jgi:hypothetical protein
VNNTETALRQRTILSYHLKQWAQNFGTDVATAVISAIQKYPFDVTIKNKRTGFENILYLTGQENCRCCHHHHVKKRGVRRVACRCCLCVNFETVGI